MTFGKKRTNKCLLIQPTVAKSQPPQSFDIIRDEVINNIIKMQRDALW